MEACAVVRRQRNSALALASIPQRVDDFAGPGAALATRRVWLLEAISKAVKQLIIASARVICYGNV